MEQTEDDEAQTMRVLSKYHIWNDVVCVRSGAEALRYLQGSGAQVPEVVLMAAALPDMSGTSLVQEMRKSPSLAEVPVVMLANTKQEEEVLRGENLPGSYAITKPVGFFKILEALQKIGVYWVVYRRQPAL